VRKHFPFTLLFLPLVLSCTFALNLTYNVYSGKGYFPIITAALLNILFAVLSVMVVMDWNTSYPSFLTKQGVYVWTGGSKISKEKIEEALNVFMSKLPKYSGNLVSTEEISVLLNGVTIEFSPFVNWDLFGWTIHEKNGLQHKKYIKLYWNGSVRKSGLLHLLAHTVQQCVACRRRTQLLKVRQP
jgi:hypothetical protein